MIVGLDKLVGRLNRMESTLQSVAAEACAASAERCEALAKEFVPVDTGALRESIHVENGADASSVIAATQYAAKVEYGTSKMRPQPYMLPAAWQSADGFFAQVRLGLQKRRASK